jgi:hypothetical protein
MAFQDAVVMPPKLKGDPDDPCTVFQRTGETPRGMESSTSTTVSPNSSKKNISLDTEGASSTGTDGTRHDSDSLSTSDHDTAMDEELPMLPIDGIYEHHEEAFYSGFRTPDPLDSMPFGRVHPAFSESEVAEALARHALNVETQEDEKGESGTQNCPDAIRFPVFVPVPVPMRSPFAPQSPMHVPMSLPRVPNVIVPPGYKLVPFPGPPKPDEVSTPDPAHKHRKIFVGGLSPTTTETSLVKYFSAFGPLEDATVIREGNKSRGFGFVQFRDCIPADVVEEKHIIDQRRCRATVAVPRDIDG